jgi:hypothetical protein
MTTNAQTIAALTQAKELLQAQCDDADGPTLSQINTSIHKLSGEIGALEAAALDNANYVPATDPFKQATADAQDFVGTLNQLKDAFGDVAAVAGALDTVVKLITKGAL